jgi:two-component system chemotaxis response regulator CheB
MEEFKNIIVIGASAGGISAVTQVIANLPANIDAAVMVVLHLSRQSNAAHIVAGFQRHTTLICGVADNMEPMMQGHLYLAPQDQHLFVKNGNLLVNQGTPENKYRPAIDVLFRSAAVNYGNRVIGVVLTGMLDDGTSGMSAIQRCGGLCIVQDIKEAEYDDMPRNVLNQVKVDHQATLADIPYIIQDLISRPLPPVKDVPPELQIEADLTEQMMSDINQLKIIADRSDFVCPDCGGGLWAIKNDPTHRYRCHTGHVYTEKLLYQEQGTGLEESIWVSIRILEERRNLLLSMQTHAKESGNDELGTSYQQRADEMNKHIERLKGVLSKIIIDLGQPGK